MTHTEERVGTRRDFLYVATGAVGCIATAAAVWPLINQMNPAADTLEPRPGPYEELYALYGSLHEASRDTQHALAARQQ